MKAKLELISPFVRSGSIRVGTNGIGRRFSKASGCNTWAQFFLDFLPTPLDGYQISGRAKASKSKLFSRSWAKVWS